MLAEQILNHMTSILPSFDDDLKRAAYNEIAESEGLAPMSENTMHLDFFIRDSLLEPVIEMIIEGAAGSNVSKNNSVH